jgi:dienelactone hydrolase
MMYRLNYLILLLAVLSSCLSNNGKVKTADPQKLQASLKDTVYATPVEPEEGAARLQALLQEYTDLTSWEQRRKCLREGLLTAMELNPMPEKTPITPLYGGHTELASCTVDNVAFESVPGVWVTGNLYRPTHKTGACPAILLAHGHGKAEPLESCPRFSESTQRLAASLASMGAVVFAYDMFAFGESAYHAGVKAHRTSLAQTVQTWNSIRIIDFLASLDGVDAQRIGMTGASGGGTQTFLAAAIDERIRVCVPVVQVSCFFPGGCPCESGRPLHRQCGVLSNNAEIAALAAPRDQLIISDGKDWTRTVDKVEFPYVRTVYGFYGSEDKVENAHFPDEGHDYGFNKRCAAYRFFASKMGLDLTKITDGNGEIDESKYEPLSADRLAVFPDKKLPEGAIHSPEEIYVALCVN